MKLSWAAFATFGAPSESARINTAANTATKSKIANDFFDISTDCFIDISINK